MSQDKLVSSTLIDSIYAAALGEENWDVFLNKLRNATGTRLVTLLSFNNASQIPSLNTAAGDGSAWVSDCVKVYDTTFYQHDPAASVIGNWPAGRWYEDIACLSEQFRSKHVFYQEFMRAFDFGSLSGLFIHREGNDSAFLSLIGDKGTQGLLESHRHAIDVLSPHISRALQTQVRLRQLETRAAIAEASLHSLSFPVFILDEARTLIYANDAANQLIANEPALAFRQGQFFPTAQYAHADWRQACAVGGMLLRRSSGKPLPLTLIPIPERSRLTQLSPRRLVLMTATDSQTPETKVQRLRTFFGLSAAEADLAILLSCEGLSPQECADARGVLITTVRSQIKSIYTKIGVSRTAQLSQLVLQL
ncbi:helix-turn-helix transcriptional regulator [Burkholderia sp. Bp8998]|uniref:helix-turn-helix transcriptional regulator n=1 Tax=Burkholderia sp. Bp8998 TaxID=2184557 RepID=UPI000F5ADB40|nr:helix-turn-helix transcriptional regulator [Burkholderia sp. Bp8998]RQS12135.1 helix-turn-helix transcriptional regulator [Burkholderia sp. Bp8998]